MVAAPANDEEEEEEQTGYAGDMAIWILIFDTKNGLGRRSVQNHAPFMWIMDW